MLVYIHHSCVEAEFYKILVVQDGIMDNGIMLRWNNAKELLSMTSVKDPWAFTQ